MSELITPLYSRHVELGGKIVPFAGYLLPVQYPSGLVKEHMAVRQQAGLFDVSHMGEVLIQGADAFRNVQNFVTVDVAEMTDGSVKYTPMCNYEGGVVDDILVYRVSDKCYYLVVNASNRHKDVEWMKANLKGDAILTDISDTVGQIALQGPAAIELMKRCIDCDDNRPKKYYTFTIDGKLKGHRCLISRTGYTGELGYEIYSAAKDIGDIWDMLLKEGAELGVIPCGLGARDTLRLEAAMPLYGHELRDDITPLEASLDFFVKTDRDDFIGRDAMLKKGVLRKRVGLRVTGRGIIRENCDVYSNDKLIGQVSSGTLCPFVGEAIGMALIDIDYTDIGTEFEVDVRGRRVPVTVIPLPFYKRPTTK
ncbi:MAG: glycine cleavage system aminomethyltransferase GcvT [Eubacteriales bacterium]|nr:glycine cleavage system aminomethyltransferase GcvT [Eubacteriales bacterium]